VAWAGTAEVHERVLTEFTKARMKRIQALINYKLFPFLILKGYPLKGYEFRFYELKYKKENTIDNKSYAEPSPAKENEKGESEVLGFFGRARKP
ncbi:MAG: hypothetical protein LUG65_08030, partial [Clostridiales bacterium]|nr:hypothetical protein [Clostridiales bacterium]